jgi:hypothetical protein
MKWRLSTNTAVAGSRFGDRTQSLGAPLARRALGDECDPRDGSGVPTYKRFLARAPCAVIRLGTLPELMRGDSMNPAPSAASAARKRAEACLGGPYRQIALSRFLGLLPQHLACWSSVCGAACRIHIEPCGAADYSFADAPPPHDSALSVHRDRRYQRQEEIMAAIANREIHVIISPLLTLITIERRSFESALPFLPWRLPSGSQKEETLS